MGPAHPVEVEHGLAHVTERLANTQAHARINPLHLGQQGHILTDVICLGRRRIAPVIRRDDQKIAFYHRIQELGHPAIDVL